MADTTDRRNAARTEQTGAALADHIENFRRRIVQDALQEAESAYWFRRSEAMEAARRRPGDYAGAATAEDLAARDVRLAATALACRRRAQLATLQTATDLEAVVDAALQEQQIAC